MEIDYRMGVYVPYKICAKCNKIEPTAEIVYMDNGEVFSRRHYCEHAAICRNAIELMITEGGSEE